MTESNSASGNVPVNTFSAFSSFTSPAASQSGTPQPQASSAFKSPQSQHPAADPFAALASVGTPSQSTTPAPQAAAANDDDEWNFASALPAQASPSIPREHKATVCNGDIKVEMFAKRSAGSSSAVQLLFSFSNNTAQPIQQVHFQTAVVKVCNSLLCPFYDALF